MKGATEYYHLFKGRSQQIGRLYIQTRLHARGECFEIYLLPEGRIEKGQTLSSRKDVVELYGVTSGQRGWTETYGWLHKGKWQEDFNVIVEQKKDERSLKNQEFEDEEKEKKVLEKAEINKLLGTYV